MKKYWTKEEQVILVDALYVRESGRFVGADFTPEYVHAVRQLMGPDLFASVKCLRNRMKNMTHVGHEWIQLGPGEVVCCCRLSCMGCVHQKPGVFKQMFLKMKGCR